MGKCAQADLRAAESSSVKADERAHYLLSQVLKHWVLSCSLWSHISSHDVFGKIVHPLFQPNVPKQQVSQCILCLGSNTDDLAGANCFVMCYEKHFSALIEMVKKICVKFSSTLVPHFIFQMGTRVLEFIKMRRNCVYHFKFLQKLCCF